MELVDEFGNVQVLEAQSSRWSLSTAGTPLEGFFPSHSRSLSRTRLNASTSDLRAKSLYDEPGRKKTLLTKTRRDENLMPSTKSFQPLTVSIGMDEDANTHQLASPANSTETAVCPVSAHSTTATLVETEKAQSWKRRKVSLGKIVNYPSKILGKILPRRDNSLKERITPALRSAPPAIVPPDLLPPLRRAETTIRRPKRSSELQRPGESAKRWSVTSTQAIRAERFSRSIDGSPVDLKKTTDPGVPPPLPPKPSPVPALTRSMTQPAQNSRGSHNNKTLRLPKRNQSERRYPRSVTNTETISTIADKIAVNEPNQHDSWDFLDYYAQSGMLKNA